MTNIADRLALARAKIKQASNDSSHVRLLAVSKTKPATDVLDAYRAGQREFGENYVQEGVEKVAMLADYQDVIWHFIGPLQSNKTRLVATHFDWVQSVDREKIATRLAEQRSEGTSPLQICIQVNIDNESQKAGVLPEDVPALAAHINALPTLTLRGLMAIPSNTQDAAQQKASFDAMHDLFQRLKAQYKQVDTLSMGMSGDLDTAIQAGSTMVRLGTAIFGQREKKKQ